MSMINVYEKVYEDIIWTCKKLIPIICISIVLSQCAIYRTRTFKPATKIEPFENWNIIIGFSAYESSGVDPSLHHNYGLYLCVTTFKKSWGTRQGSYTKSEYDATIKLIKMFYGKNNEIEIAINEWNKYSFPGEKTCWSHDKHSIYIPPDINELAIVTEIEYLLDNKSFTKKYTIPMKRHETSFPFFEMR